MHVGGLTSPFHGAEIAVPIRGRFAFAKAGPASITQENKQ